MVNSSTKTDIGWFGIFRLGLVRAAIGAVVVITTSTLNRVSRSVTNRVQSSTESAVGSPLATPCVKPRACRTCATPGNATAPSPYIAACSN